MRIVLTETGGFVGIPLQYEVDVSGLPTTVLAALEVAMSQAEKAPGPPATSAGATRIRWEQEGGRVREAVVSHASPAASGGEIAKLVEVLRAHARPKGAR
ncbi:MAG TPA: hypothetical protein VI078_15000 [bacterium]